MLNIQIRFARCKLYLRLYNNDLRRASAKRGCEIIAVLNRMWQTLSAGEQRYIQSREQW